MLRPGHFRNRLGLTNGPGLRLLLCSNSGHGMDCRMADEAKVALGRNVRRLITWGMYGLGLACLGALGLRSILTNLPIELAPDLLRPASLWKVLISLYALSWYYGTTFDNRYQIDVITSAPEGRLPIGSVAVAVTIFVLFAAMWWLDVFSDTIANAYLPWLGAATLQAARNVRYSLRRASGVGG